MKEVQINITVGRAEPLTSDECEAVAAKFLSAVPTIAVQLRGGALSIPLKVTVGEPATVEDACRICRKTRSELKKLGIDLHPFAPQSQGVRAQMEACKPSAVTFWDCHCLERAAVDKAAADRREWERRNPVAPMYLPAPKAASADEVAELRKQSATSDEVAELRARLAKLEGERAAIV
jgi:hypothetical protein